MKFPDTIYVTADVSDIEEILLINKDIEEISTLEETDPQVAIYKLVKVSKLVVERRLE